MWKDSFGVSTARGLIFDEFKSRRLHEERKFLVKIIFKNSQETLRFYNDQPVNAV
jgi:hypothetical protein